MSTNETMTRAEAVAAIRRPGTKVYGWVHMDSDLNPIAVQIIKADAIRELCRFDADEILNYVEVNLGHVWIG